MLFANRYSYSTDLIAEGIEDWHDQLDDANDAAVMARLDGLRPSALVPYGFDPQAVREYGELLAQLSPLCEDAQRLRDEYGAMCGPYGSQWESELGWDA